MRTAVVRWGLLPVLALFLTACGLHQEVRFAADGSGTASGRFVIEERCALPQEKCSAWAEELLLGEGPVANATAAAESLPFDVRIGPLEDPAEGQTGYTLSFDFESVEDLQRKLAPEPDSPVEAVTHRGGNPSQTSPFTFRSMTLEPEGDRLVFVASAVLTPCVIGVDPASFAIVLPGTPGQSDADDVRKVPGGTRFEWDMATEGRVEMRATTILPAEEGSGWLPITLAGGAALLVGALAAAVVTRVRRRTQPRPLAGGEPSPVS